jgi:hypothetical protein
VSDDASTALAEQLREAHRRLAAWDADEATKHDAMRRLLAISDTSKRDTRRAATRLRRFLDDLGDDVSASHDVR